MVTSVVSQSIVFGTDGVRGHADKFPFTPGALNALGKAIGRLSCEKYGKATPRFLIGTDTRISSSRIKTMLAAGMLCEGVLISDAGIIPTPALYQIIASDASFDAGVVISASHNPFYDNGIKVFDARRCKITPQDEVRIIYLFEQFLQEKTVCPECPSKPLAKTRCIEGCERSASLQQLHDAAARYRQHMESLFPASFLKKVKVVLDCANGATSWVAPEIFEALGATVHTIAANPTGTNINEQCGSLHPGGLAQAVLQHQADCGFAFDGDGDRVVAVNKQGHIKDGDDVLALVLSLPAYQDVERAVGTSMTNQGFEQYLAQAGKHLVRTAVGEKYVYEALEKENLPLGGEVSGHIIMRDYLPTGDGIFVALKVLEAILYHQNWDMKTFEKYPQVLINVPVVQKKDLSQAPFAALITEFEQRLGGGRLLVRYSGTESVLRVMTESASQALSQAVAQDLAHALQEKLQSS